MTRVVTASVLALLIASPAWAAPVFVPNHSFEAPGPDPILAGAGLPVNFTIDDWDEDAYGLADEGTFGGFDTNTGQPIGVGLDTGIFVNSPEGQPGHLANTDGAQAGFLFARNSRWIRQELGTNWAADAKYSLTLGVASSSQQPVAQDSGLEFALYYDNDGDPNTETITILGSFIVRGSDIASYDVNNGQFLGSPAFVDFTLADIMPTLDALGLPIGILIRPEQIGDAADAARFGVWDVDNVRLNVEAVNGSVVPTPSAAALMLAAFGGLAVRRPRRRR